MTTDPWPELSLAPTAFRKGNVPAHGDSDLTARINVLDLQEQMPSIQRLRDWTMDVLAPRPGDVVVDVGCGSGTEVRRLAGLVAPGGRAIGVEPDGPMRAEAERRTSAERSPATFVDGDAGALPFEDGSIDLLRCERVFQHLTDPETAARESPECWHRVAVSSWWTATGAAPCRRRATRRSCDVSTSLRGARWPIRSPGDTSRGSCVEPA